jgi:hypothetical protein
VMVVKRSLDNAGVIADKLPGPAAIFRAIESISVFRIDQRRDTVGFLFGMRESNSAPVTIRQARIFRFFTEFSGMESVV